MLNDQRAIATISRDQEQDHEDDDEHIRDIHALTPPHPPPVNPAAGRRRENWETSIHRSSSLSSEGTPSENFTTMSREFNALVIAGSAIGTNVGNDYNDGTRNGNNLARIGEDEMPEETNPLAIVPNNNPPLDPVPSPRRATSSNSTGGSSVISHHSEVSVLRVKKEEVETKISAWQNAKVAKVNNRFKREDAVINGWENEQVQKSTSWMKKVEVTYGS